MSKKPIREVVFYKDYYLKFYKTLDNRTRLKLNWTIQLLEEQEHIPSRYFKHLTGTGGLYEIRVQVQSNIYRVFCFFDEGTIIIAINGFQKKTQKTPIKEIKIAKTIRKEYFDEKEK